MADRTRITILLAPFVCLIAGSTIYLCRVVYVEEPEIPTKEEIQARFARDSKYSPGPEDFPDHLPKWTATEPVPEKLGPPFAIEPFEISPPLVFRYIYYDEKNRTYAWKGATRDDDTFAQFLVAKVPLTPTEAKLPLTVLLRTIMRAMEQHHSEWEETPFEYGTINGITFVRSSWSGNISGPPRGGGLVGRTGKGMIYLTKTDDHIFQIMCRDVAPDHEEWLRQGGIAAMTFRAAPEQDAAKR